MQKRVAFATVAVALLIAASLILWLWAGSDIAASPESSETTASQVLPLEDTVPVHIWISNQSLGTGIAALQMTVALDGAVIFDEMMAVETQHNVAMIDNAVTAGAHGVDVTVGAPHNLLTSEAIEISDEVWIFVSF